MNKMIGRNDPCPCGSGKKYKQCCLMKLAKKKQKLTAKWLNPPQGTNLMERTFGQAITSSAKVFTPLNDSSADSKVPETKEEEQGT